MSEFSDLRNALKSITGKAYVYAISVVVPRAVFVEPEYIEPVRGYLVTVGLHKDIVVYQE